MLFTHLLAAEETRSAAARNVKRLRAGKPVPRAPSGDWEIELLVANRVVRQLRSVGDALAWRCFGFDRRYIVALSRNAPTGPMVGKEGLEYELGEVVTIWRNERCVALLHDLTNALRIADITKFTKRGPLLVEVKRRAGRIPAAQMRRMRQVLEALNEAGPLPGEREVGLFVSRQQLKTRLAALERVLRVADQKGWAVVPLGHEWVVSCLSVASPNLPEDVGSALALLREHQDRAFTKAGLHRVRHRLQVVGADRPSSHPAVAPFAIYPFDSDTCARLTCDLLAYKSVMSWDRLAGALEAKGFRTECPLPESSEDLDPEQPVVVAHLGARGVTVPGSGIDQLLREFIDPARYAAAVREMLGARLTWEAAVLTFANEKAVWR